jgi:hypothetical protein
MKSHEFEDVVEDRNPFNDKGINYISGDFTVEEHNEFISIDNLNHSPRKRHCDLREEWMIVI